MKYLRVIFTLLFVVVVSVFITNPTKYMQSFFNGLTVWAYNVLPAVFPFAVLITFVLKIAPRVRHSVTDKLFHIHCDSLFTMSLMCGYPIGAKAIADSNADTTTATAMCAFCSSAGPIFMIATVGANLLANQIATVILIVTHILALLLNGLIYRPKQPVKTISFSNAEDFGNIVTNSLLSVLSVGGLIALFYMLTDIVKSIIPFEISGSLAFSFSIGLLEMTNGIFSICSNADIATATVLCSTLLSFGGVCVFCQCYAFLGTKKIKAIDVLKMKLTQSAFATILSFIFVKIFM